MADDSGRGATAFIRDADSPGAGKRRIDGLLAAFILPSSIRGRLPCGQMIILEPAAIVAAAIAPALLLLWLVVAADSRPEPPRVVWAAFILGTLSIFVLHYVTAWLVPRIQVPQHPWLAGIPASRAIADALAPGSSVAAASRSFSPNSSAAAAQPM